MKVHFKRLAAAAAAVAMSLSLSVSALAAGTDVANGRLTVTGDQLAGKYVYAIQMFEAHALDHGAGEGPQYTYDSYTLNEKWLPFFNDEKNISKQDWVDAGVIEETADTIEDYSDAALAYVEWLADENQKEELMTFANDAKKWAESKDVFKRTYGAGDQASMLQSVTVDSAWTNYAHAQKAIKDGTDETKGTTTFTSLNTGYYLVYPEGGSTGVAGQTQGVYTGDARGTDAMLINIPTNETSTTWNIKSTFPTVDKKVDTNITEGDNHGDATDNGSAQVGDTVTFTLTSAVPDMSDYTTFYFAFNDTLSNGLEFVTGSVKVTIGSVADEALQSYYQVTEPSEGNNELVVKFENLKDVSGIQTGDAITVTYQAKITEDAVSTGDNIFGTAENEANVEYSNDPDSEGHGTSTPDKSKVYTYDIKIEKYWVDAASGSVEVDDSWDGNHGMEIESLSLDTNEKYLAGATFVLSTSQATPTKTGDSAAYGSEVVRLTGKVNTGLTVDPDGTVTEFTTEDAAVIIKGLEAGTYYLHEIDAPDGFNKLKEPVKIQIIVEPDDEITGTEKADLDNPVYIIDDEVNTEADNAVKVENKQGVELPETGSIGTIGLTVAGVVIVAIGLFAMPRKKKDQD